MSHFRKIFICSTCVFVIMCLAVQPLMAQDYYGAEVDDFSAGTQQNFGGNIDPQDIDAMYANEDMDDSYGAQNQGLDPLLQQIGSYGRPQVVGNSTYVGDDSKYTLGKEDVIEIQVMRHPEVSGIYLVNAEGKIQYEFVGDIKVDGLLKNEVRDLLSERLSTFIVSPDITVKIVGYNSKIVYVVGEVARPGKVIMNGDTITVREALIQSGLPLLTGKIKKAFVITPSEDGRPKKKKVNVDKLLYKGDLRENLVMNPGDTLYIPATFMAKTMRAIQPVAAPISTAAGTGRTVTTGF